MGERGENVRGVECLIRKDDDVGSLDGLPRDEVGAHALGRPVLFEVIQGVDSPHPVYVKLILEA